MTLPAWKTFLASWHANAPVPLTSKNMRMSFVQKKKNKLAGRRDLHPAGIKTVLPSSEPLYFLNTCKAVAAARGNAAASAKERPLGFSATKRSLVLTNSLHAPVKTLYQFLNIIIIFQHLTSVDLGQSRIDLVSDFHASYLLSNLHNYACRIIANFVWKT